MNWNFRKKNNEHSSNDENNSNIVKFKKPRMSHEQRKKFLIRIVAIIGVVLTIGGLVIGCLYSIL